MKYGNICDAISLAPEKGIRFAANLSVFAFLRAKVSIVAAIVSKLADDPIASRFMVFSKIE